jgi:hypothetical protein
MTDLAADNDELIENLKGAFSDHEIIRITVDVSMFNRELPSRQISAVKISEVWALHPAIEWPGKWTCTHVPSGFCLGAWPSADRALMVLGVVVASGVTWETLTSNDDLHRWYAEQPEMKAAITRGLVIIRDMDDV